MKSNRTTLGQIASTFVGLALAGTALSTEPTPPSKTPAAKAKDSPKGECHGVNSCKGKGECGGPNWDCAGNNDCKGKGWITKTEAQCKKLGGKFKAEPKAQ